MDPQATPDLITVPAVWKLRSVDRLYGSADCDHDFKLTTRVCYKCGITKSEAEDEGAEPILPVVSVVYELQLGKDLLRNEGRPPMIAEARIPAEMFDDIRFDAAKLEELVGHAMERDLAEAMLAFAEKLHPAAPSDDPPDPHDPTA